MMKDEPIVMRDSAEAANQVKVTAWKSRHGIICIDEDSARYNGCTHVACRDCGKPTPKSWLICRGCDDLRRIERYEKMPKAKWDGTSYLYSETHERYVETLDDAFDLLESEGETLHDLRLVLCHPNYAREIDSEYFSDELPEDGDLPGSVEEAIEQFNKAIAGTILSWSPGKFALDVEATLAACPPAPGSDEKETK